MKHRFFVIIAIFVFIFSSCTSKSGEQGVELQQSPTQTPSLIPSITPTPTITITPTPTLTSTPEIPVDINNYFPFPLSTISVNNISNLELLGKIGEGQLLSVDISVDQSKIIAIYNTQVVILDSETLETENRFDVDIPLDVGIDYQISPNSTHLAILLDSSLLMYDLIDGEPIESFNVTFNPNSRHRFSQFEFSTNGQFFMCRLDADIKWGIWSAVTEEFVFAEEGVKPQFISENQVVIGYGKTFIIRSLKTIDGVSYAEDIFQMNVEGDIVSYTVTDNGRYLSVTSLVGNENLSYQRSIWNLLTKEKIISNHPVSIEFSPSGQFAYARQRRGDRTYNFWRVEDGQLMNTLSNISIYSPIFNNDESKMALVEYQNGVQSVLIYDTERFFQLTRIPFGDQTASNFFITEDKKLIIVYSSSSQEIKIIDFESGKRVSTVKGIVDTNIQAVGNHYMIASSKKATEIYQIPSGECVFQIPIHAKIIKPIDETILLVDEFNNFSLWSIQQEKEITSLQPVVNSRSYLSLESSASLLEWENILSEETMDTIYEVSHKSDAHTELPERNYSKIAQIFIKYQSGKINVYKNMSEYSLKGYENATLAYEIEANDIKENLLRLTPDGKIIIGAENTKTLHFWSTDTGELIKSIT